MQVFWRDSNSNNSCFYAITLNCNVQRRMRRNQLLFDMIHIFAKLPIYHTWAYPYSRWIGHRPYSRGWYFYLHDFNEPIPTVMSEQDILGKNRAPLGKSLAWKWINIVMLCTYSFKVVWGCFCLWWWLKLTLTHSDVRLRYLSFILSSLPCFEALCFNSLSFPRKHDTLYLCQKLIKFIWNYSSLLQFKHLTHN